MENRKLILGAKFGIMVLVCTTLLMSACANPALEHLELGDTHADQGEWDAAIAEYDRAIELDSDLAMAYNSRGTVYGQKGELDKAIADYNKAIELNPELAWAYLNRGNAYYDKGELDTATADYNRAIELNPELAWAYLNQGSAYYDDKGFVIGTVLYGDGTPANGVYMYIFRDEEPRCFAFCTIGIDGRYIFNYLPLGRYEIYSSGMKLGSECGGWECVEKEVYRAFARPPEVVRINRSQLVIAPTRTHFREIKMHYCKEYINTTQPEISWDPVPTADLYKVTIVDGYLNKEECEDYEKEVTISDTSIIWPDQLTEMNYMISVYAYDQDGTYLTDAYELFWIGPREKIAESNVDTTRVFLMCCSSLDSPSFAHKGMWTRDRRNE